MARQTLNCTITGDSPLILHNGQTADPLNKFAKDIKRISSKRAKTDADYQEMARIEWFASLYLDNGKVCIPSEVFESAIASGARKLKLGKQAQATLFCPSNIELDFEGKEMTVEQLWERDANRLTVGVRIGQQKIMRTRFIAKKWSAKVAITYEDTMLNRQQVEEMIKATGEQVGLCDWRPKFGRFTVTA